MSLPLALFEKREKKKKTREKSIGTVSSMFNDKHGLAFTQAE